MDPYEPHFCNGVRVAGGRQIASVIQLCFCTMLSWEDTKSSNYPFAESVTHSSSYVRWQRGCIALQSPCRSPSSNSWRRKSSAQSPWLPLARQSRPDKIPGKSRPCLALAVSRTSQSIGTNPQAARYGDGQGSTTRDLDSPWTRNLLNHMWTEDGAVGDNSQRQASVEKLASTATYMPTRISVST
jgi:hypothetical protein